MINDIQKNNLLLNDCNKAIKRKNNVKSIFWFNMFIYEGNLDFD